ncbi:MAG: LAGLIDADG family homing endonuclease [Pyrinomonadaceae bacterium]
MTVKSDRWIRRMAEESNLIQPFNAQLVREVEGRRIISAGASSYGYDMRLADDGFRVFSPVHGREIDPKHFDEESLIEPPLRTADDGSKYYLLPPHSYGLGVTVETFQMPRNVTGIALGKCLTKDARIIDAKTGDLISIADFSQDGKVLAHENGRLNQHGALAVVAQGRKAVFTLKTKIGHKITATASHPFLTVTGWQELSELKIGSRIAAARRVPVFGREEIPDWEATLLGLMIAEGQCHTPGSSPTFTSADAALVETLTTAATGLGVQVSYNGHFGYCLVNRKGRGGIAATNKATLWLKSYDLNVGALQKFVPSKIFRAPKRSIAQFLRALFSGDGSIYLTKTKRSEGAAIEYCSSSERLARDVHHLLLRFGIVSKLREKKTTNAPTFTIQILRSADVITFLDEIGFLPGSAKDRKAQSEIRPLLETRQINQRRLYDTLPRDFWATLKTEAASFATTLYASGLHVRNTGQDVTYLELEKFLRHCPQSELKSYLDSDVIWDEVVSIEESGEEEVFDICVPRVSNFVANNLIVHNSTYARVGLLVNTTPLEAGWTGRLVVELANLADLPLRVYVNEGIGQVIFLESDEDCDVSYEDRGGKYQNQKGLTYSRL